MIPGVLVTGTDTGVGKTAVACGLVACLRRRGLRVAAFKPVESGHEGADPWPPDGRALRDASGLPLPRKDVVPYVLREPLAPLVGAPREGVAISVETLDGAWERLCAAAGFVVVEGAGGIAVPLAPGLTISDLAVRWNLPVVVVARPGLGTINHTILTVEHAHRRGLVVAGVVVNGMPADPGVAEQTNPDALRRLLSVPVWTVPRLEGVDIEAGTWQPMVPHLEKVAAALAAEDSSGA